MRVPSFYALSTYSLDKNTHPLSPVLGTVFGAIHCVGWFYTFPTYTEARFWCVCSLTLLVTTVPALCSILVGILSACEDTDDYGLYMALIIATITVYFLVRLALLVEAVISLRALPTKACANVE
ncbi:hypothetical protein BU17DRAFT_47235 [Hysterangium stoloniferum]|nr:hypothetical protein BU17DRAFT_47235 [Hysterangium stoloniferum]